MAQFSRSSTTALVMMEVKVPIFHSVNLEKIATTVATVSCIHRLRRRRPLGQSAHRVLLLHRRCLCRPRHRRHRLLHHRNRWEHSKDVETSDLLITHLAPITLPMTIDIQGA